MPKDAKALWEAYRDTEFVRIIPVARALGYELEPEQVHIGGERYLQSGAKLVLLARSIRDRTRVVIKASSRPSGKREIAREHEKRRVLRDLEFAYRIFDSPEELAYGTWEGVLCSISEYIQETRGLLQHSLSDQFFLALNAFKGQEGVHATTGAHARAIRRAFGLTSARDYLNSFAGYREAARTDYPSDARLHDTFQRAESFLKEHEDIIEGYCGFLTHTDFVPHNLRIREGRVYLLDHASLAFGNKYESWGRFLNYMNLYHPSLERSLMEYVRLNRSDLEYLSLRLMRAYKLGMLLAYYTDSLTKTTDDLYLLSEKRIVFWSKVLDGVLDDTEIPEGVIDTYRRERDALRSEEEKDRQRALNQL